MFGYLFGVVVFLNIFVIVVEIVLIELGLNYGEVNKKIFFGIDFFCVGIFIIEYMVCLYFVL